MRCIKNRSNDIYIYTNAKRERSNLRLTTSWYQWNITLQNKETIIHVIRYTKNKINDLYVGKERERLSKLRLAIAGYQGDIISSQEEDDIAHQEIH